LIILNKFIIECRVYFSLFKKKRSLCNEPLTGEALKKALDIAFELMKGINLVKYGRVGEP